MNTLKDRLRAALKAANPPIKKSKIADFCGIKPSSVSDWFSGRTKTITGDNLLLTAKLLEVRPEWLLTGKGPMRPLSAEHLLESTNAQFTQHAEKPSNISARFKHPSKDKFTFVELLGAPIQCAEEPKKRPEVFKQMEWFAALNCEPQDTVYYLVNDDTNADYIVPGDVCYFDKSKTELKAGRLYLIDHPGGLRICLIEMSIDRSIALTYRNKSQVIYPVEKVAADKLTSLRIIGELVARETTGC